LIEPEVEQDALMDLLARVEKAAASQIPEAEAAPLSFPERLVVEEVVPQELVAPPVPVPTVVDVQPVMNQAPSAPLVEPATADGKKPFVPPNQGWSVQVAAYTTAAEADNRVAILRALDLEAWRAEALVKGRTWYRVRIGAHKSHDAAQAAAKKIAVQLGTNDLMVARIGR
jgi:cell division protein FtsN